VRDATKDDDLELDLCRWADDGGYTPPESEPAIPITPVTIKPKPTAEEIPWQVEGV